MLMRAVAAVALLLLLLLMVVDPVATASLEP